ncbi:unnamed protein product (macronuclear) [Paramecium tetraurelia]|uniref:Armadillo-type fold n=1 Tax=Paramecium tetraurelia TaxID=5888 RepID=A0EB34_PARTE|nr:uncharacterized protein GSPATT00025235001 [Paramecium tetraurelia]CAK92501.1 unnamed protein product [Paramecium tetraurelia]|eukprot:XP_001459898.1 hypothetical protein (macronuclear) [Paramecium tetraurelia strain d4-2]
MDTIKQKWKNYTLQKRLKDLWEDYKKVSNLSEDPQTLKKFQQFLEQANITIKNFLKSNDQQLEVILGDANQVLVVILDYLNKFPEIQKRNADQGQLVQDIMEQCIQLAEQILREPKYRKSVENSHNVLSDFLNLIEKAQKTESKVLIIKLIVLFSENLNQRIEFFEQQGFHKLLSILMNKDPQLNRVISKALLHFLLIEDINQVVICNVEDSQEQTIKQKFSKIAGSLRSFAFQELSKVFLPTQNNKQQSIKQFSVEKKEILTLQQAIEQQISLQSIFEVDLSFYMNSQSISRSTSDQDQNKNEIYEKIISISSTPPERLALSLTQSERSQSEDILKEFQVLQGGFKAILETLEKATSEVQVDLLQTVQQILQNNARNKIEFKRVNGYQILSDFISHKDLQDEQFQQQFYNFLKQISTTETEIDDLDAFTLMLELLPIQQDKILNIIVEVLNMNWKNVIIAKRLKLYYYLAIIQIRQYLSSDQISEKFCNIDNEYMFTNFKNILVKVKFQQSDEICQQLFQLYEQLNSLEGFYSLEFEAIQSQLAILFIDDIEKFKQIVGFAFKMIEIKMSKKCRYMNSFDHQSELAFRNFSIIFDKIYHTFLQAKKNNMQDAKDQSNYVFFIQIVEIINKFLGCEHNVQKQEVDIFKNMVSQNRCEQFMNLIKPNLKLIQSKQILELFDFEYNEKSNLAIAHLQFRLNQVMFNSLAGIMRHNDLKIEPQMVIYLIYSQYEMWNALEQQPLNPITPLLEFLMDISKLNPQYLQCISHFFFKIKLLDENTLVIENLIQFLKQNDFKNQELIVNMLISICKNLPYYFDMVNLYPVLIQYIEIYLNKVDLEQWFDFVFSGETIKKLNEQNYGATMSDILSLLSIHSMFQDKVLDKMINGEYLTNSFATLQYETTKEQSIKLSNILYLLNAKSNKIKNPIYGNKQKFFQLIQKLINAEEFSNQLCNTVYKLVFWNFDSYHLLYTENSSNVSSVMGRSEFAEIIQKTQKQYLENKQPIQHITNLESLELFFLMLGKNNSQSYIIEVLKIFESILDNQNLATLLDSNIIQSLCMLLQNTDKRILQQIYKIIRTIIQYDLSKSTKLKIIDILKRHDDASHILIDYLKDLLQNPVIKNDYMTYLKNFDFLVKNFEELVGFNEEIDILLFQIINLMASKNSPEIRSVLKQLNLFEFRDNLALQIIKYKMEPQQLMDILSGVPFAQLCNSRNFKESHCMAYLLQRLIQHKDHFGLTLLIIKILKYDISSIEDNRRYVSKLLQNDQLISFFYPQMLRKSSKSLKCFDQDDQKNQRSNSPETDAAFSQNMTVDQFLTLFFSDKLQDERQQIKLTLERALIPVESEYKKQIMKYNMKKQNRLAKLSEQEQSDNLRIQTSNNDWEFKIQSRLKKSNERSKMRSQKQQEQFEQLLADGENQWFKLCLGQ